MNNPELIIKECFVDTPNELFSYIRNNVEWDERMKARKTASFGVSYDYSGITYPQTKMFPALDSICKKIEVEIGFLPNNCLINYYRDGNSKMGYHSDSSEELRPGTGVAIISLGAERHISYRSKNNKEHKVKYLLKNGALLYMDNKVQDEWTHAIPKTSDTGERISLTFRHILK
ncbi:MAG: alpha-ketoglutarate-dependent dioxygenase AlkB [Kangiellaceae bacterium]|nr:alpha-ketoglutarate-dependent dioxygenase AlkB [Kangiellaceae bacterium]MCW9017178.1 alpha-ketoglutarate-dependent dioxygenase AlkB [Kangiellaceae bacterium]